MLRVWALLIASMLFGSALLTWLEPQPLRTQTTPPPRQRAQHARLAADAHDVPLRSWHGVEIVGLPRRDVRPSNPVALRAVAPEPGVHFVVSDQGLVQARPAWQRQSAVSNGEVIRIGLVEADGSGQVGEGQFLALAALLDELGLILDREQGTGAFKIRLAADGRTLSCAANLRRMLAMRYPRG